MGGNFVTGLTGNPFYTDAADISTAISSASAALKTANDSGDTDAIRTKEELFDVAYKLGVLYVQAKVMPVTDEALAIQMVQSANLSYKRKGSINITTLSVDQLPIPGTVKIRRKSEGRVAYIYQQSTDMSSDANWKTVKITSGVATIELSGLVAGTRYWFRVAVVKGSVEGDFCDPVTIIVG